METNEAGKGLTAFTALRALKRRKLYLLVPVLLVTGAVSVATLWLPERFRARTLIAAEPGISGNYLTGSSGAAAVANVQDQLRTIRETLLSDPVLKTVMTEFHLNYGEGRTPEQKLEALKSKIQIQVEGPDAFYVSFEGERPLQAMRVTNRLAELFIERTSGLHGERVEQADSFLDAEVERLQSQVREQDESLTNYKQGMAHVLPERLATNLKLLENLQQQVRTKTDQITEAQARRLAVSEEMKALEKQGALETGLREKTPAEVSLDELRAKLRGLKARYTAKNPEIERTEREIRDLEASAIPAGNRRDPSPVQMRYLALKAEADSIDPRLRSYQQERSALAADLGMYERRIDSSPGLETTLAQRVRDAALTRSQYEAMLAKQQKAKLDQRLEKSTKDVEFKIAEAAQLPKTPSSPQRNRLILLGFVAGLGLGLIAVLVMELMDTSFDTIEEFQSFTNLPVLSAVPTISSRAARFPRGKKPDSGRVASLDLEDGAIAPGQLRHYQEHRLAVLSDPQSIPAEQYSILAMKVEQWMEKSGGQVLVVTSAAGDEGKSVTALNLSLALAASMKGRVLLVDSDLRRPQVHHYLGLRTTKGFSDLLADPGSDVSPYISKLGSLDVIAGGDSPANPVGLLASPRSREFLAQMRKEYRLIVLYSPPIVPIADSHVLAGLADGVVIIVRARQTRRELFRRAIESLGAANILGVVLNDVEYGDTRYAYAYRHYQRHYLERS
jgi:polysaccharide chain length determinant protein (PEP-CTERM system associated)